MSNTIDMQNESLEDLITGYINKTKSETDYNCADIHLEYAIKHGANWQKEKDKAVIDKAFHLLQWAHKVINASVPKQAGYGAIEILPDIEQLLNQLKK